MFYGKNKYFNNEQIAYALVAAESLMAFDESNALGLYEKAIEHVTDANRQVVAELLKQLGSEIDVLSSNVQCILKEHPQKRRNQMNNIKGRLHTLLTRSADYLKLNGSKISEEEYDEVAEILDAIKALVVNLDEHLDD